MAEFKNKDINGDDVKFLRELYYLMEKNNIHRIYSATLDNNGKIIVAHQSLNSIIERDKLSNKIIHFIYKHFPRFYFGVIFKTYMNKHKPKLRRLFGKYNVKKINANSLNLHQGVYIRNDKLYIRDLDFEYEDGRKFHIDELYLDI